MNPTKDQRVQNPVVISYESEVTSIWELKKGFKEGVILEPVLKCRFWL